MNEKNLLTEESSIEALSERAYEEDVRSADITTNAILDADQKAKATWVAKEKGIVAGLDIGQKVFQKLDPEINWQTHVGDGEEVESGSQIVEIEGAARAILTAERIALNIAQRMSGIATMTQQFVAQIADLDTKILDTRKTVPGLRLLDKKAVVAGGGTNHRMGLFDLAMIKDNHIVAAGSITDAVLKVRNAQPDIQIEVETTSLKEVQEALSAGANLIMLDNMSLQLMREAVSSINGKAKVEASGNITLQSVREVAQTGVDYISVGALTHSVQAFDISQQLQAISK